MKACCTLALSMLVLALAGCGLEEGKYKKSGYGSESMAITNAEGERDVLRTGTSLSLMTTEKLALKANMIYKVTVKNLSTGTELAKAELLSDMAGQIALATVAHDLGEFDDVQARHSLSVRIEDKLGGNTITEMTLPVTPHEVHFEGHGFQIDEVQPPHVYSADATGKPLNAIVIGGAPDPGEVAAPIYVAGGGFPQSASSVDIYVVRDRDEWRGKTIPKQGDPDHLLGPIAGKVERGILQATRLDWTPDKIGPLDVLVDVDRNGTFDYSFSAKDGADGEGKVGFTVQYGAAWLRAKQAIEGKHVLVNLAYNSAQRNGGEWANTYSRSSKIWSYVNPPVMQKYHFGVGKIVVAHQSWSQFWNNPAKYTQTASGAMGVPIPEGVQATVGTPQQGCTNSPPVAAINPAALPVEPQIQKFNIVFDSNKNGIYEPGVDLLDVVAHVTDGNLITAKDLAALPDDQIFGFQVAK
jgi:hypothetical protein